MIAAFVRSMRWADLLIFSITDPRALYREIKDKEVEAVIFGSLVLVLMALSGKLASSILQPQSLYFYYKISYGLILTILIYAVQIIIFASLMDLYSQMTGIRGSVRGMTALLIYSFFPMSFILPLTSIFTVFNFAPVFFYTFFWVLLFVKCSYNAVSGISEMLSITAPRAFSIFIFPFLFLFASGFFITLLMIICGYGYFLS